MTNADRLLVQLDPPNGDRIVEIVERPTDRDREIAGPVFDEIIDRVAADLNLHPSHAAAAVLGYAIEAKRDREAYEREALRRGLLPL